MNKHKFRKRNQGNYSIRESIEGYLFISPVVLGILIFTAWPVIQSFYLGFTDYNIITPPKWIGSGHYQKMIHDSAFWHSLKITFEYTFLSVPLNLVAGFLLALCLKRKVPGVGIFRTIFYIPVVVPVVAMGVLWKQLYSPQFGFANELLQWFGLPAYSWFSRPETVMPSLLIMCLWQAGGAMIIWLAGLQGVPEHLYEAAIIDGASPLKRFWNITIPMVTPVIFFNLVMGLIAAFQVFGQVLVTTNGGPVEASNFMMVNIYTTAFSKMNMGYASAMAWALFIIIMLFTGLVFRTSRSWVHYEEGVRS